MVERSVFEARRCSSSSWNKPYSNSKTHWAGSRIHGNASIRSRAALSPTWASEAVRKPSGVPPGVRSTVNGTPAAGPPRAPLPSRAEPLPGSGSAPPPSGVALRAAASALQRLLAGPAPASLPRLPLSRVLGASGCRCRRRNGGGARQPRSEPARASTPMGHLRRQRRRITTGCQLHIATSTHLQRTPSLLIRSIRIRHGRCGAGQQCRGRQGGAVRQGCTTPLPPRAFSRAQPRDAYILRLLARHDEPGAPNALIRHPPESAPRAVAASHRAASGHEHRRPGNEVNFRQGHQSHSREAPRLRSAVPVRVGVYKVVQTPSGVDSASGGCKRAGPQATLLMLTFRCVCVCGVPLSEEYCLTQITSSQTAGARIAQGGERMARYNPYSGILTEHTPVQPTHSARPALGLPQSFCCASPNLEWMPNDQRSP